MFQEIPVFQIAQRVHALHVGAVAGCTQRQFDPARFEEGSHAIVTELAVDIERVVGVDIKRNERFARLRGCCSRKLSKSFFHADCMYARRLGQHPVEIEQYRVVVSRGECGEDLSSKL